MSCRPVEILQARTGLSRFLPIGASVLCLTAAVLFVKYFSFRMDVHTQNFFRYCGASVFLSILVNIIYPGCFRRLVVRLPVFLLLGAMVVGFQICWVNSVYRLGPAFVSLLGKFSTILITIAAFLLYHEERSVVGTKRFGAGFVMGLAGMAGVVIGMPNFQLGLPENELAGIFFLLGAATIWAVYVNVVKHVVATENSMQAFTFTCVCATVYLLPIMLIWGQPSTLTDDMWLLGLVLLSGIIGVAGANTNYYLSIKRIGIARSANLALAHPFTTALASFFIFDEILTVTQWVFGAVLIAGCALIISIRERRQPAPPPEEVGAETVVTD